MASNPGGPKTTHEEPLISVQVIIIPSFGVGLSLASHPTRSHHFGQKSDQIRSMCIALCSCISEMQVYVCIVNERETGKEKDRK